MLVAHDNLWSSVSTSRSVLHVALLDGTDPFLLDLTLRYAATQSKKPDEVVILTAGQVLLEVENTRKTGREDHRFFTGTDDFLEGNKLEVKNWETYIN